MTEPLTRKKANRLMQAMIAVSVLVHGVLLVYISGIYRSESLTVIELSMKDGIEPSGRAIPRPRIRPPAPAVTLPSIPKAMPRCDMPTEDKTLAKALMETIQTPISTADQVEGLSGLFSGDGQGLFSKNDYYDMVRMKIESAKQYPEKARGRMIEGRVTVRFTITPDGQVSSLAILKYSGHRSLDQAALKAVENASPFARPPSNLFDGPLHMELTITFELT
ncbi:MAG: energy transducer TonB [Proteobacteria bacterium]|nr:energy transducer TonB [Pseudomonadota bacterium]